MLTKYKQVEAENTCLKKSNETLQKDLHDLNIQTSKIKTEAVKSEETVAYMFTRTKSLSTLISGFYAHCYGGAEPEQSKTEYVLSFESLHNKLERIFKDYETLAKKSKRFDFSTDTTESDAHRFSLNSQSNTKNRRTTSTNVMAKTNNTFRSKSPAPGFGRLHNRDAYMGGSNRLWNEQNQLN